MSGRWLRRVPRFIEAQSPEELEEEMLLLNMKTGKFHEFISIQKVGSKWYAWYYLNSEDKTEVLDD